MGSVSEICNLSCPFWDVGGWLGQRPPDLRLAGRVRHCSRDQLFGSSSLSPLVLDFLLQLLDALCCHQQ